MAEMTRSDIEAFLGEPRDGVLSVVLPSGRAMGTPVWFVWADGVARFQSPTTSSKTAALRATGRGSLCVHEHQLPSTSYVTIEGPVREIEFDLDTSIGVAAAHYLGSAAAPFIDSIEHAIASGREWASFELRPTFLTGKLQRLG